MHQRKLKGHSGCSVLLCEESGRKPFIRKISGTAEYNERLHQQMLKQERFKGDGVLHSPKVYEGGYTDDGLFYFDMQYIQGITLSEYMKRIEIGKIRGVVDGLIKNIDCEGSRNAEGESIFRDKIEDVSAKLPEDYSMAKLAAHKLLAHDWSTFGNSWCHGDLTFENIIIKNDEMYLIDFLDSFYESGLLDVATLLQDALVQWSYREGTADENTLIRMIVFKDILLDSLKGKMDENYTEVYYALLLKLLRIYPYADSEKTVQFLDDKVNMLMGTLEG